MEEEVFKTILSSRYEGGWFGSNYTINLYRGCCHGCIYCDSRSECYQVRDFDRPRPKKDALAILQRELVSKRKRGLVLTGSMSDAYNPLEKSLLLTRGALALLNRCGFGAAIDTKSALAARDADLLLRIASHDPAIVSFTVTTADDALCRRIERNVSVTSDRLRALETLRVKGLDAGVLLMPLLPFINDTAANIEAVVRLAADAGAQWIYPGPVNGFGVTLRTNQRAYFLDMLDEGFPGLRPRYERAFGYAYECGSPNPDLWPAFLQACRQHHILWDMKDITPFVWRRAQREQLSLF